MGSGHLAWEVVEVATGEVVHRGERAVRPAEVEVLVRPGMPLPRPGRAVRAFAAGLFGWLVTRGRARTTKRLRLGEGYWLVLAEQPGPKRARGFALLAERDGARTFCWEWFDVAGAGATATKLQEDGSLRLEWTRNRRGDLEITRVELLTDVSLRLSRDGEDPRRPTWRVRVRSGSVVDWPQAGDGLQLVPRLRPDGR